MKQVMKFWLTGVLCLLLAMTSAMPAIATSSANIKERRHQPPDVSSINRIYAIDQENQTYHNLPQSEWKRVRNALALSVTPAQSENKNAKYVGGFCFELQNGVRRIYTISTAQVLVTNTPLFATVAERTALEKLSKSLTATYPASPAMLAFMEPQNLLRVTADGYGATNNRIDSDKSFSVDFTSSANLQSILDLAEMLKNIEVNARSTSITQGLRMPSSTNNNSISITLYFNTGTNYQIVINDGLLRMYSSDGTRTYSYELTGYDPRRPSASIDMQLRNTLWDFYYKGGNYSSAAIFLTKPGNARGRIQGAFYSKDDGGTNTVVRLGQILDDIRTATPSGKIYASKTNYLEVYAQTSNGCERFELDPDSLTAYYIEAGRGRSVPISYDDYQYVRTLLTGRDRSNRTILAEESNGESYAIQTLSTRDPLVGDLYDPKEKDDTYQPYTTGSLPSYAKGESFICWADTGKLSCSTIYDNGILVQNSNKKPWTPAKFNSRTTYRDVGYFFSKRPYYTGA